MEDAIRPEAWLGRRGRRNWFLLVCAGGLAFALVSSLGFSGPDEREELVFFVGTPWIVGFLAVRRTGLWIGVDEVVVRGFFRNRQVPIERALRFSPGIFGWVGNGYPAPGLETLDGDRIAVFSLGREGVVWKFDEYLEQMKAVCEGW